MFIPALYGYFADEDHASRVFFYGGVLFLFLTTILGIATSANMDKNVIRSHLLALLGAFTVLPVMLAVPTYEAIGNTTFINAYFEMVSSITTTGATLFDEPERLSQTVHMWRATVGWMGGLLMWVAAIAIFAPLNIGGFEITARRRISATSAHHVYAENTITPGQRVLMHFSRLLPIYVGLTFVLWICLILAGSTPFEALCHAMSTISTSGISPVGGIQNAGGGIFAELLIFIFLFFAISRLTFAPETQSDSLERLGRDPEFRMGLICAIGLPCLLFLRHWVGAIEVNEVENVSAAIRVLWGSAFTVLSFLTTTGFLSDHWAEARSWSGLQTPGLILMGVALIGGGVATTAGGVKLLRVFALYKHGMREIEKVIHPSSVGGAGEAARHLRGKGAQMAWVFFMLFAISICVVAVALSLTGLNFEDSLVMTISSLSTTGPLAEAVSNGEVLYSGLSTSSKFIVAAAMVLGRLETLAIIALLNPGFWRS
ncbi:TrkH family potassium uptake protein [Cochlodiniinecator piscidefendens]|uniref:TrkH family potassium uptake protein n=1 Tax=Cochlodiniinecator piscidefendens TaxID=2715756 RepID=UPI001E615C8D|nr:potassium transporter TrkG [Cochlodiniinecator piscidefendens]